MIRLTCTNCKQLLTIDDAFAGGVCRCQFCGTIQTVPLHMKGSSTVAKAGATASSKTLYKNDARNPGSGLEQLGEIVTSSGLSSSGLRQRAAGQQAVTLAPRKAVPMLMIAGALIVLLVGVIVILVMRNASGPAPVPAAGGGPAPAVGGAGTPPTDSGTPVAVTGPNFCGMAIEGDSVVYVLDNGSSASDILSSMEAATLQSVKSLGPDRRFKVVFWEEHNPVYPAGGTARASADEIKKCEAKLEDAYAQGSTKVDWALKPAMGVKPDAVVIVTSKASQLPDTFTNTVMSIRGRSTAHVYTVGVEGDSNADPSKPGMLSAVASKTGGQFLNISAGDLGRSGR